MSFSKRHRVIYIAIMSVFAIILALPGCKEGTKTSPISSLITGSDLVVSTKLPDAEEANKFVLSGMVLENMLTPLAGIEVELYYNGKFALMKKTTDEGKFFFNGIPMGQYEIVAAHKDKIYASSTSIIEILEEGKTSPLNIVFDLKKK